MKKWRIITGLCIICMVCTMFPTPIYSQENQNQAQQISAKMGDSAAASILLDQTSGRVLYAKKENDEMKIASLTKIMTAILAVEKGDLQDLVTIQPSAVGVEGSSIYLKAGEKVPLEALLYGLMLRSGNDAATAIAQHIGGSLEGFVYLMNEKAQELGLQHTHFTNPHGLDEEKHYSSAKDLALLTQYALRNPIFQQIVKTELKTVEWPGEEWKRTLLNKNKLLKMYPFADGVKTGYTKQAKRTLVTSATKDGQQLIAVTLNDGDDWKDHMNLFDYGFQNFQLREVVKKDQKITSTEMVNKEKKRLILVAGKSLSFPLQNSETSQVKMESTVSYPLEKVEKNGVLVGTAKVYFEQELVGIVPIYSKFTQDPSILNSWMEVLAFMCGRMGQGD
ncbi:D-alanyl-D-alanine carboxypeptidase family protein [Thermoactinomyces sp. DSM 45892]|uniref:D-alanyl-D-alanine carboxypeptidase family protein n=1 Tax=Thermoactinomyces sp. DSM 45892 TaxID=1882753 RepID=UPI00089CED3B|nr:D-alanyl-D-alanine carboxypeptidase family protein [Thermoactinomyces sp. DSM 45892]SDZ09187.1 D-alanyl-D-alanine carboxypeptidase [Thermoactinomyces sp. DSM 45892]